MFCKMTCECRTSDSNKKLQKGDVTPITPWTMETNAYTTQESCRHGDMERLID